MLGVEVLEVLDDVVRAFASEVGRDHVAGGVDGSARMEQHVGDADLTAQHVEDVVAHVFGNDHA